MAQSVRVQAGKDQVQKLAERVRELEGRGFWGVLEVHFRDGRISKTVTSDVEPWDKQEGGD